MSKIVHAVLAIISIATIITVPGPSALADVLEELIENPERKLRIGYRVKAPPFSWGPTTRTLSDDDRKGFTVEICKRVRDEIALAVIEAREVRADTVMQEAVSEADVLRAAAETATTDAEADSLRSNARMIERAAVESAERLSSELDEFWYSWIPIQRGDRWNALTNAPDTEQIDFLCGPTTITRRRMAFVDFSLVYFVTGAIAIVDVDGAELTTPQISRDMFTDGDVGVISNSSSEAAIIEMFEIKPESFPTFRSALDKLDSGGIKVLVGDRELLLEAFETYAKERDEQYRNRFAFSEALTYEPYAIPMRRGEHRLKCLVDTAIAKFFEKRAGVKTVFEDTFGRPFEKATTALQTLFLINQIPEGSNPDEEASCVSGRK